MFEFNLDEHKYKYVHFIGIGGISMSGLAHLLYEKDIKLPALIEVNQTQSKF